MVDLIRSAIAVTGAFRSKVTTRRLLLILKHEKKNYVMEATDPDIFNIAKHEVSTAVAHRVLSAGGKGPWPLFSNLNVLQKGGKYRSGSFVREHIVYDVLMIADCGMLGLAKGVDLFQALEAKGFACKDFDSHPFAYNIKLVLNMT